MKTETEYNTQARTIDGYRVTISMHVDQDMGPPWEEHDGHGEVSEWTARDKRPGEWKLCTDRRSARFYDAAGAIQKAKDEGWGLCDGDKAALAVKLGKPVESLTRGEIVTEAVRRDFALACSPAGVTACEIAPQCAGVLFERFPGVQLLQRDFLEVQPPREGNCGLVIKETRPVFFDRVVMNPPFHMRSDIRHIEHALKFLNAGGVLVALCMDTPHREKALRHLSSTWEPIPAGAFRSEGTSVPTVLLTIQS